MNPKIKKIIEWIDVKDDIAKTALFWTGIFTLVFWLIFQEISRMDLQNSVKQLEQESKSSSEQVSVLQKRVKQLTKSRVKQLEQESKKISYSEQVSALQDRIKQLEQDIVKQSAYEKNKLPRTNTNITRKNQ